MPNCKFNEPEVCDACHRKEFETLAENERAFRKICRPKAVLPEVIYRIGKIRRLQRGQRLLLTKRVSVSSPGLRNV